MNINTIRLISIFKLNFSLCVTCLYVYYIALHGVEYCSQQQLMHNLLPFYKKMISTIFLVRNWFIERRATKRCKKNEILEIYECLLCGICEYIFKGFVSDARIFDAATFLLYEYQILSYIRYSPKIYDRMIGQWFWYLMQHIKLNSLKQTNKPLYQVSGLSLKVL